MPSVRKHTVRAQRVPFPHPVADLRRARVDASPCRLVQRVLSQVRKGDGRLLRPGSGGRADARSASRARTRSRPWSPSSRSRRARSCARVYETAYDAYVRLVEQGVAREVARSVLPVGAYTEFYWTVNARSLMNFVSLRAAETAQREIRRYADAVEQFFAQEHADHARGVRRERPRRAVARPRSSAARGRARRASPAAAGR